MTMAVSFLLLMFATVFGVAACLPGKLSPLLALFLVWLFSGLIQSCVTNEWVWMETYDYLRRSWRLSFYTWVAGLTFWALGFAYRHLFVVWH